MTRDHRAYLQDMISAIDECADVTAGLTLEEFAKNRGAKATAILNLQVLGEAAKRIPPEIKKRVPDVPWKDMAGFRDKLVHDYFGIDVNIVWRVVHHELPPARPKLVALLRQLNQEYYDENRPH